MIRILCMPRIHVVVISLLSIITQCMCQVPCSPAWMSADALLLGRRLSRVTRILPSLSKLTYRHRYRKHLRTHPSLENTSLSANTASCDRSRNRSIPRNIFSDALATPPAQTTHPFLVAKITTPTIIISAAQHPPGVTLWD